MGGAEADRIFEAVAQGPVETDMRETDQRDRFGRRAAEREPRGAER
jgi:hypothetical protein